MANIRKTFNFRNGVQVDNDNLVVSPLGLVGIGTTLPTVELDVYGDIKSTGIITSKGLVVAGVSTFNENVNVGTSVTIYSSSGIISATKFYGDAASLSNLPTSQWVDVDVGAGFTSIYSRGNVGVATTNPSFTFQVGQNPITARGIGINSSGDVYTSGIVTAYSYVGFGTGITNLNASNISSGTLDNARLAPNVNLSGILTAPFIRSNNLVVTGVITATGGFSGNVTGNITGNLTGTATTALSLSGTPNIVVGIVTADRIGSNISTTGISTVTNRLFVQNSIGVNTVAPTSEIHVLKSGVGGILVTGTEEGYIGVARSLTRGQNGGEIRFGNLTDSFSGERSFDIVNYDTGNINQYLHLGSAGVGTGNFNWVYGPNQTALMTLTYGGRLGIAKTNPDHEFHVVGTSTITEDLYVGDDLFVTGDSELLGALSVSGNVTVPSISITEGITQNIYSTSGVSTFSTINVTDQAKISQLAIGATTTTFPLQIGSSFSNDVLVFSSANFIGIGTNVPTNEVQISAQNSSVIIRSVGVGTTRPRCAGDFADAGKGYFSDAKRYFIPPRVTTAERNALDIATVDARGALVYNVSLGSHEAYNGSTWSTIGAGGGGGGSISYAQNAGIATFATIAGFSTNAANVIGGIVTCGALVVSGISTFAGDITGINVTGISTFSSHIGGNSAVFTGIVTATDFNSTSDIALKENVELINNPLDKLLSLRGVTFDWKNNKKSGVGVVAQDVEKVLPQAVGGTENSKTVNYNAIIGLLVESVKQQQKEIEDLKKRLS